MQSAAPKKKTGSSSAEPMKSGIGAAGRDLVLDSGRSKAKTRAGHPLSVPNSVTHPHPQDIQVSPLDLLPPVRMSLLSFGNIT